MWYSTGAVKRERVSWVLRREVCTWFCFATCTRNRNEGNTKSGKTDVIPREKHTSENGGKGAASQPHTTTHGPAQTDSRGSRAVAHAGIGTWLQYNLLPLTPDPLPAPSASPGSLHDTALPPASSKPTAPSRHRKCKKCHFKEQNGVLTLP